jgi:outer membrane lipoprotein-sorting protein
MNSDAIKARLWMWGPFVLLALLFTVLLFVVFLLDRSDSEGGEQADSPPEGSAEKTPLERLSGAFLAANGGEQTLASLQSARFSGTLETGGEKIPYVSIKKRPNRSHLSFLFPNYKLSLVVDGEDVWQRISIEGKDPVNSLVDREDASDIRRLGMFFDPVTMVLLLDEGTVDGVSRGAWEGRSCFILEFTNTRLDLKSTAYIDSETMHPLARLDQLESGSVRTLLFSDYRAVDGFQYPFATETYLDDKLENRVVIETVKHNMGTFSSLFEFPEPAP